MVSSLSLKLPLEQTWHPRLGQHSQNTASVPKQEVMMSPHGTVSSCFQGWTFLHIWDLPLAWKAFLQPSSPGKCSALPTQVSSALCASAAPLCSVFAHTASVTATSSARLFSEMRGKSSVYTMLEPHSGAGRSSGRASPPHFLTLHS